MFRRQIPPTKFALRLPYWWTTLAHMDGTEVTVTEKEVMWGETRYVVHTDLGVRLIPANYLKTDSQLQALTQ